MYLLGFDIGSSSVKVSLVRAHDSATIATVQSPTSEMDMIALHPGWAEQHPETWWEHCCLAVKQLLQQTHIDKTSVAAIGISYQMHGLVAIDADGHTVRPSIIWCDSRAVDIGNQAFREIGADYCLEHYLNSPGNFTASKLRWVQEHEAERFARIRHVFLPGDYIAFRMTGEATTTVGGLSEGILWDFKNNQPAYRLLEHWGIDHALIPDIVPTFGQHGKLSTTAASELGLASGTPVTYRAGDQPNNALSLNVLQPGEVAATGGTSGVVYGVVDQRASDPQNRVNSFAHVNHTPDQPRIGVLLCINGAGIQYSWVRRNMALEGQSYNDLERLATQAPIGSDGLRMIPFGNGAERMLGNQNPGAQILNLHFNRHGREHLYRAALEGIACSFVYGVQVLQELGLNVSVLRVGNDNLFQSAIFSHTIAQLLDCRIEMLHTTGATGAAIAAGVGIGLWAEAGEGLGELKTVGVYEPVADNRAPYQELYADWAEKLEQQLQP